MKTRRKNVAVAVLAAILAVALSVALFAFVPTARASETVGESAAPLPAEAPEGTIAIIEATVLDSGEQPAVTYCDSFETLQQTLYRYRRLGYVRCSHANYYDVTLTLYSDIDTGDYVLMLYGIERLTFDFNTYTVRAPITAKCLPIEDTCGCTENEIPYHQGGNATPFASGADPADKAKTGGVISIDAGVYTNAPEITLKNGSIANTGYGVYPYEVSQNSRSALYIGSKADVLLENMTITEHVGGYNSYSAVRLAGGTNTVTVSNSTLAGGDHGIYAQAGPSIYIKDSRISAQTDSGVGVGVYSVYPNGGNHSCSLDHHDVVLQIEGDSTVISGGIYGVYFETIDMMDFVVEDLGDGFDYVTSPIRAKHLGSVIVKGGKITATGLSEELTSQELLTSIVPPAAMCVVAADWLVEYDWQYLSSIPQNVQIEGGTFEMTDDRFCAVNLIVNGEVDVSGGEFYGGNGIYDVSEIFSEIMGSELPYDLSEKAAGLSISTAESVNISGGKFYGGYGVSVNTNNMYQKIIDVGSSMQGEPSTLPDTVISNVTISDGVFEGTEAALSIDYGRLDAPDAVQTAVEGGQYDGAVEAVACENFVAGGKFTQPLEENYLAANAAQSESGVVVPAEQTNAVASVTASDGSVTYYDVLHDAFLAAKEGETIDILRNVTDAEGRTGALESIGVWLYIQDKSVTINGNGCTLTASDCGWGLYIVNSTGKDYSVTISDLTIVSTGNGLWPMEVCNGHYTVTLDNVTLDNSGIQTASSSAAFTVGGSGENTVVTVQNGSVLNAGERGYAIRVLNPVDLTVDNSTLKGRTALYMQGRFSSVGSAGSVVVIENGSVLETVAPGSLSSGSEEFGTLVFEMGGVDVTIRDSEVSASSEEGAQAQGVVFYSDFYVGAGNPIEDVTVRFENTDIRLDGVRLTYGAGDDSAAGGSTPTAEAVTVAGGSVNVLIEQKYMAAGYVFAAENGGYSVVSEEYAAANFDAYIAGQDGEIYYPSLQEAIAAVKDGDVITVLDDITFTSYLSIFKIDGVESFTLDLNKHTITLAHGGAPFALQVSGYNYNDANDPTGFAFIVKNGTIKGDAGSAKNAAELIYITNQARLIAEDLVIEYSAPNSSAMAVSLGGIYKDISTDPVTEYPHRLTNVTVNSMQAGGVQVTSGEAIFENCTFNIEKGDATGNAWVYSSVAVSHSGTAVVESGTYTSDTYGAYIFSSGGNFVINGGSFSAGENYAVLKSDRDDTATFLTIVIHDGSFSGPINVENSTEMTLYGGKYSTQLNTAWLAPDCAQMEGDGSFTVGKVEYLVAEQNAVAMVEETGVAYTSLQAAFDAVDGEATVILLNDIIFGENENFTKYNLESGYGSDFGYYYSIDENQNIVLDLNGKKIDASGYGGENHQNGDWLFENKGTFTIKNGTILAFKDVEYYVNGVQGLVYSVPGASVTVESGEFSCIVGFANSEDSVVNIEGGEFNFSNIFPIAVLVGTNQGKGGTVNIGKQGAAGPILNLPYENESVQSLAVFDSEWFGYNL